MQVQTTEVEIKYSESKDDIDVVNFLKVERDITV